MEAETLLHRQEPWSADTRPHPFWGQTEQDRMPSSAEAWALPVELHLQNHKTSGENNSSREKSERNFWNLASLRTANFRSYPSLLPHKSTSRVSDRMKPVKNIFQLLEVSTEWQIYIYNNLNNIIIYKYLIYLYIQNKYIYIHLMVSVHTQQDRNTAPTVTWRNRWSRLGFILPSWIKRASW